MKNKVCSFILLIMLLIVSITIEAQDEEACIDVSGFWDFNAFDSVITEFNNKMSEEVFTTYCVNYTEINRASYSSSLTSRIAAGEALPDLMAMPDLHTMAQLALDGYLEPLENFDLNSYNYRSNWIEYGSIQPDIYTEEEGIWYALPVTAYPLSMAWLPDMFGTSEVTSESSFLVFIVHDLLIQNSGAEAAEDLATGLLSFNSPEVVSAWQILLEATENYESTEILNYLLETWETEEGPLQVGGEYLGVFADYERNQSQQEALVAFLQYLSSEDGANAWTNAGLGFSPHNAVESPITEASDISLFTYELLPSQYRTIFDMESSSLSLVLSGEISAEEALFELDSNYTDLYYQLLEEQGWIPEQESAFLMDFDRRTENMNLWFFATGICYFRRYICGAYTCASWTW